MSAAATATVAGATSGSQLEQDELFDHGIHQAQSEHAPISLAMLVPDLVFFAVLASVLYMLLGEVFPRSKIFSADSEFNRRFNPLQRALSWL